MLLPIDTIENPQETVRMENITIRIKAFDDTPTRFYLLAVLTRMVVVAPFVWYRTTSRTISGETEF